MDNSGGTHPQEKHQRVIQWELSKTDLCWGGLLAKCPHLNPVSQGSGGTDSSQHVMLL